MNDRRGNPSSNRPKGQAEAGLRWIATAARSIQLGNYGILAGLILLILLFAILSPTFLTSTNILNLLRQVSVNGIIAVGMTLIILTGGIDLSVGSTFALAGLLSATFAVRDPSPFNVILAFLLPLLAGGFIGMLNGAASGYLRIPPFIVTLGMMTIVRGTAYMYTNAQPIANLPSWYNAFGEGYVGPIPIPVITFLLVVAVASFAQEVTRFGRYTYAVGGNLEAARASGVPVNRIIMIVYIVGGALAGLSAIILTGRLHVAQTIAGTGYELNAIAAAVIGGTSFSGGRGGVQRTLVGALVIGVLLNGLNLLNVTSYIQQILIGVIIVGAVWLDGKFGAGK